ncbi:MAG: hypothetical protein ACHP8B_15500 [Terriglobales bacterium]
MRYPYTRIDETLPTRPYVNFFLRVGFATTDTLFGLVDSGADYSILPWEFARTLKINIHEGRVWNFRGTTGKLQIAYIHRVEMCIWDPDIEKLAFRFDTEVSFCEDFKFHGGVLLGQIGFLSAFKAVFNQPENYFDLEPHDPGISAQPPFNFGQR